MTMMSVRNRFDFALTNDTLLITLMGEQWGVFWEYVENMSDIPWPPFMQTTINLLALSTCKMPQIIRCLAIYHRGIWAPLLVNISRAGVSTLTPQGVGGGNGRRANNIDATILWWILNKYPYRYSQYVLVSIFKAQHKFIYKIAW